MLQSYQYFSFSVTLFLKSHRKLQEIGGFSRDLDKVKKQLTRSWLIAETMLVPLGGGRGEVWGWRVVLMRGSWCYPSAHIRAAVPKSLVRDGLGCLTCRRLGERKGGM